MAEMKIVLYPDAPLQDEAEPITEFDSSLRELAQDMFETMYAEDGVGLAGPQVGVSKQILVAHDPDLDPICLVNPSIFESEGEETSEEGCLSIPQIYAPVSRATRIRVHALNLDGKPYDFEATGLLARIIQHEVDHLHGVVFLDRTDVFSREDRLREWDAVRGRLVSAASRS